MIEHVNLPERHPDRIEYDELVLYVYFHCAPKIKQRLDTPFPGDGTHTTYADVLLRSSQLYGDDWEAAIGHDPFKELVAPPGALIGYDEEWLSKELEKRLQYCPNSPWTAHDIQAVDNGAGVKHIPRTSLAARAVWDRLSSLLRVTERRTADILRMHDRESDWHQQSLPQKMEVRAGRSDWWTRLMIGCSGPGT